MHTDIPTRPELENLIATRSPAAVSIYLETTPLTQDIGLARTALGNLLKEAVAQLEAIDTPKRTIWPIEEQIADLLDDDSFWAHQSNALAIFVTPENLRSHRLPNRLKSMVQVSDRFHVKPLWRALSVNQHAFVLALQENEVRLVEVFADLPAEEVRVPDLPRDGASAAGVANVNSRSFSGRIGGAEGQKVLLRAYARQVDAALRPVLAGRHEPLILAGVDPLLPIYRSINSYDGLAAAAITGSATRMSAADLAAAARPILDALQAEEVARLNALYATREAEGRASTQIARAARAATFGAVDTLMVDIDTVVPGTVDEAGEISFAAAESAASYGVIDEIAARVVGAGGRVVALRRDEIPQNEALAVILRYAI
jgi:hypothetical protein